MIELNNVKDQVFKKIQQTKNEKKNMDDSHIEKQKENVTNFCFLKQII